MKEDSSVRDELARERTFLANERTLLSYGRTALGLVGLAVLIFKFGTQTTDIFGGVCVLFAAGAIMFYGMKSYRQVNMRLSGEEQEVQPAFGQLFSYLKNE